MSEEIERIGESYTHDSLGNPYKKPVEKRAKCSKFALALKNMTDQEIKALGYCLLKSERVKKAIDCWNTSVEHGAQLYALEQEYRLRTIKQIKEPHP